MAPLIGITTSEVRRAEHTQPLPEGEPLQHEMALGMPYVRALQTAELFRAAGGACGEPPICFDERLREKEFGILDGLTKAGIAERFPDQHEMRMLFGKFYHRPPGGESWCDVIARLRSVVGTVTREYSTNDRVLIVCHSIVVNHNAAMGMAAYDLRAGDRRDLATGATHLVWLRVQRKLARFGIEHRLEKWKHALTSRGRRIAGTPVGYHPA